MTKTETAQLLTLIAAFDRRTIGETDVEAWHLILSDLQADDCAEAVKNHFRASRDWLMPADVRTYAAKAARRREGQQRLARLEAEIAAENPELRSRPAAALTVGQSVPFDDPARVERRQELRRTADSRRRQVEAEAESRAAHQRRLAEARAELDAKRETV